MASSATDDASAVPTGYFRAKSGTLCKLPNPPRTGAAVAAGAPVKTAVDLRSKRTCDGEENTPTLKALRTALKDHRRAQSREATPDFVARVNCRTDAAYGLQVDSLAEADAKVRLLLASDGDSLDAPVLEAIKTVATFLSAAAA